MKSKPRKTVTHTGPERVAYILPQGRVHVKTRPSGRSTRPKLNDPSGFVVVGMGESLAKTFTSHEAAAKWATENGFRVVATKVTRPPVRPSARAGLVLAVASMLSV
jgi:hypothetical protein